MPDRNRRAHFDAPGETNECQRNELFTGPYVVLWRCPWAKPRQNRSTSPTTRRAPVDGETGVRHLLESLHIEFDLAMALSGASRVEDPPNAHRPKAAKTVAKKILKISVKVVLVFVLLFIGGAFYYHGFPTFNFPAFSHGRSVTHTNTPGLSYADTLIVVAEELNSNWMPNDILWPTILLDNPQSYQLGILQAIRTGMFVLVEHLTRMRTTDDKDRDCEQAFKLINNDEFKWWFPSYEKRAGESIAHLKEYRRRLAAGQGQFRPVADNLVEFIKRATSDLGGISQRLANASRDQETRITEETVGDTTLGDERRIKHHTPWREIDNEYFFAMGYLYVLREEMVALRSDFAEIIERRKVEQLLDAIIEILNVTQADPWMVLNGSFGSLRANHSLQLQGRLEDVRQKMRSLQSVLET